MLRGCGGVQYLISSLAAIWVTAREQIAWRRQHSRPLATVKRDATVPLAAASKDAYGA